MWPLESGHDGNIYTTETGKSYHRGLFSGHCGVKVRDPCSNKPCRDSDTHQVCTGQDLSMPQEGLFTSMGRWVVFWAVFPKVWLYDIRKSQTYLCLPEKKILTHTHPFSTFLGGGETVYLIQVLDPEKTNPQALSTCTSKLKR